MASLQLEMTMHTQTPPAAIGWAFCLAAVTCTPATLGETVSGDKTLPAAPTVDLRPLFIPGRTARYQVWTLRQLVRSTNTGRESQTRAEIHGEVTWSVEKVRPDGSAICVMTINWLTIKVLRPNRPIEVNDSRLDSGDTEVTYRLLTAMTGVPLTFEASANGDVLSISGTETIRDEVGEQGNAPKDLDFIESATDLALVATAPGAAQIHDQWSSQFTWSHEMGRIHHDMVYTLSAVEELAGIKVATVTGEASLMLEVDDSSFPDEGPAPDIQLTEGQVKTRILFDLSRHEAVGRNTVEDRTIRIKLDLGGRQFLTVVQERIHSQVLRIAEE